jgi:hypothetical protein
LFYLWCDLDPVEDRTIMSHAERPARTAAHRRSSAARGGGSCVIAGRWWYFQNLALLTVAAALGPMIYRADPDAVNPALPSTPGASHPRLTKAAGTCGPTARGRRFPSRWAGAIAVLAVCRVSLGAAAGRPADIADAVIMRLTDAALAISTLFLVIAALTFSARDPLASDRDRRHHGWARPRGSG